MNFLFYLLLSIAQAGYLRMVGQPHLEIQQIGHKIHLTGYYQITNEGDEIAAQVFPELRIDNFVWKGRPEDLSAGQGAQWEINEVLNSLCVKVSDKCVRALPARGEFLVKILRHYKDSNSYDFAAPDVLVLNSKSETQFKKNFSVELQIHLPAEGELDFNIQYSLKNHGDQEIKAVLHPLLPLEMKILTPALPVAVAAGGELHGILQFRNERGLPGSSYVGFVTAEWEEDNLRRSAFGYKTFQIHQEKPRNPLSSNQLFLVWFTWAICVGLIGMWLFWIRPLKKLKH